MCGCETVEYDDDFIKVLDIITERRIAEWEIYYNNMTFEKVQKYSVSFKVRLVKS